MAEPASGTQAQLAAVHRWTMTFVAIIAVSVVLYLFPYPASIGAEHIDTIRRVTFWSAKLCLPLLACTFLADGFVRRISPAMMVLYFALLLFAINNVIIGGQAWFGRRLF